MQTCMPYIMEHLKKVVVFYIMEWREYITMSLFTLLPFSTLPNFGKVTKKSGYI